MKNIHYIPHSKINLISAGSMPTIHCKKLPIILIDTKEGLYRTAIGSFTTDSNGINGHFKLIPKP